MEYLIILEYAPCSLPCVSCKYGTQFCKMLLSYDYPLLDKFSLLFTRIDY
jgi:hypothetical protein